MDHGLPPYRFGIDPGPHPTRSPDGHSFGRPEPTGDREAFARGATLLAHGFFWEAHEAWESAWRRCAREAPERPLWQALILIAASALKHARREPDAARRLAGKARDRIARAEAAGCARLFDVAAERLAALAADLAARRAPVRRLVLVP